jgi:predicted HD phosphohydrolase
MQLMTEGPPGEPTLASLLELLRAAGETEEPNEEIPGLTILHHGLQCAALLRESDPHDPELQVAGLLHDVGHLLDSGPGEAHATVGAAYLRPVFGDRVATLVDDHVRAKRYLITVDADYRARLSTGSSVTLALQGDALRADEVAEFRARPLAEETLRLRRADESAKDPGARVPGLGTWLPTLGRLTR